VIEASAPVRVCDIGGWTDTWFGGPGRVLSIAVSPGVHVRISRGRGPDPVVLDLRSYGDRYPLVPGGQREPRNALLESAVDLLPPPAGTPIEIAIESSVPAGCGTGTSATAAVAVLAALTAARSDRISAHEVALLAHRLEVEVLGNESGIQDQLAAAHGGINFISVDRYPEAEVERLPRWPRLAEVMTLVFLGQPHDSSAVHRTVIEQAHERRSSFEALRDAAAAARNAVLARDLLGLGNAMIANTEAQESLHPQLVGDAARRVMRLAAAHGAQGWKTNGAGGDGGSVTVLSPDVESKRRLDAALAGASDRYRVIRVGVSYKGVEVAGRL
jgi:D-glycero-alpha-D-manno-heptose-7-phosphate kinase